MHNKDNYMYWLSRRLVTRCYDEVSFNTPFMFSLSMTRPDFEELRAKTIEWTIRLTYTHYKHHYVFHCLIGMLYAPTSQEGKETYVDLDTIGRCQHEFISEFRKSFNVQWQFRCEQVCYGLRSGLFRSRRSSGPSISSGDQGLYEKVLSDRRPLRGGDTSYRHGRHDSGPTRTRPIPRQHHE